MRPALGGSLDLSTIVGNRFVRRERQRRSDMSSGFQNNLTRIDPCHGGSRTSELKMRRVQVRLRLWDTKFSEHSMRWSCVSQSPLRNNKATSMQSEARLRLQLCRRAALHCRGRGLEYFRT
jgi:hypothetical protein